MTIATDIQKLYVAYFNRPADFGGLLYWEDQANRNGGVAVVANAFSASPEYTNLYAGKSAVQVIDTIYQNLFGRPAEPAGLTFWSQAMINGVDIGHIALAIMNGAQNADLVAVNNKAAAAEAFYAALDTNAEIVGYSGDAANAVAAAWLKTITDDASLAAATTAAALTTVLADASDAQNIATSTAFTLTNGLDTITGTAGSDIVTGVIGSAVATNDTLTVLDTINGGAGVDTLKITDMTGGTALPAGLTVTNVEVLNFVSAAAAVVDTTTGFTGLTNLNVTKSVGADNIIAGSEAVSVVDTAGTVTIDGGSTQTVVTAGGYVLSGATGAITVTDTAQAGVDSTIDDGTSITLTTTAKNAGGTTGMIDIGGGGTAAPTGVITVVDNVTAVAAAATDTTGGAITITGGSTVSVTENATMGVMATASTNGKIVQGAVSVTGGAATTSVTVTETKAVTAVDTVLAVAAVVEKASYTFAALAAGDTLVLDGLTFTAGAAGTTAAQTAAAFANLTLGATQGNSTLGTYSGALNNSGTDAYTSGAVTGTATVLFTSTLAGAADDLTWGGSGTAPTLSGAYTGGVDKVDATGKSGVDTAAVTINDVNTGSATLAGTITSATISNYTTVSINDTALTTLSLTNGSGNIIIDNSGLTTATNKTLAVTVNGLTGGTLDDADIYTTLNITTATAKSTLANITFGGLTALTVAGDQVLTLTSTAGMTSLATVAVSGSAGLTANLSAGTVTDVNAAATSGAVTVTVDTTKATYEGGTGADAVTTSAGISKVVSLGDGDDTFTVANTITAATAAVTGGSGTDTLVMRGVDAAVADNSATFASFVSGFEHLTLTTPGTDNVDLAALGNFTYVTHAEGAATVLTLTNMASNGTVVLTGAGDSGSAVTVAVTDAATGTADVLNVIVTHTDAADAGHLTAADVETVNLTATDTTATDAAGTVDMTLDLNATKATTITVTGNANLILDNTGNIKVTSIDASAMTAGISVTTAGTLAETVKGGATSNMLTAGAGTTADHLIGGAANDTITANSGLDTLTGNGGNDNFVIATAQANVNSYSTITDANAGDTITLQHLTTSDSFTSTKVSLGDTAVFQDYANAVIAASVADNSTDAAIGWFQFGGNTYIVESLHDNTASALPSFQNSTDIVVKLTGLVDLSHASFNTDLTALLIG